MYVFLRILGLICLCFASISATASAEAPLKAAFVRDHQLWMKEGDVETQITKGRFVGNPQWSPDGRFIAYADGDERWEKSFLYIYDTEKKEVYQPYETIETTSFQWSPTANVLAYNAGGVLNVTKTKDGRPEGFENVALGVAGFAWFPNGREFIVSSTAKLTPKGWGNIPLFRVPANAKLNPRKIKFFHTIKTNDNEMFAIDADYFKWSQDGKWVSFLAIPTASLSNDSNSLCVLSSKGDRFQFIGNILGFRDWFKWSPEGTKLAYISGQGRFFVENKQTKVATIPVISQQKVYTPKGYIDRDVEWLNNEEVVVARALENKKYNEGPVPTMYTSLFAIHLKSGQQVKLTTPGEGKMDLHPQVVGNYLSWYRTTKEFAKGDVWIREINGGEDLIWLKNIDFAPIFYTPN